MMKAYRGHGENTIPTKAVTREATEPTMGEGEERRYAFSMPENAQTKKQQPLSEKKTRTFLKPPGCTDGVAAKMASL